MLSHSYTDCWDYRGYRIIDCKNCGFKHIYPIPSQDDLAQFYKDKYYQNIKPFPYRLVDQNFIEEKIKFVRTYPFYINIYEIVMKYKTTDSNKMLDIGCGNDLFGKFIQDKGWDVSVIEPNKEAGDYLQNFGLRVYNKTIEEMDLYELKDLSLVNIQFVLEHLQNPTEVLSKINQVLLPGGIIRVCVPNDFSQGQLAYIEHYQESLHWVNLPDHINYFTFDSLSKLLNKTGFTEVYRITNFPLEFLLLAGMNYYTDEGVQPKVNHLVNNFEAAFINTGRGYILEELYKSLARLGLGRSIFMYAVKR